MPYVVFLRGVNLGGKVFRPKALAEALADLEVRSIQAAGTFIVHRGKSAAAIRSRFVDALPFACEVIVRPAKEVIALVDRGPAGRIPPGAKPFISVLAKTPRSRPRLPVERPEGRSWEVRLVAVDGRYATSWQRGAAGVRLYPNEVVEKVLGVPATTRGWPTMLAVRRALEDAAKNIT